MKNGLRIAFLGICFLPSAAFAQGGYLGLGFGTANYSEDEFDDSDTSIKIFGGMRTNENFGFEFSYMDFGKQEGDFWGYSASVEPTGFGFSAVGFLPINGDFDLFAKLGLLAWDVDVTLGPYTASDDGSDLMFGFGASYRISEQFSIRGEWDSVALDGADLDSLTIAAQFNF